MKYMHMNRESFRSVSNGNPQYAAISHIGNISPGEVKKLAVRAVWDNFFHIRQ